MGDAPSEPRLYEKWLADPAVYAEVMSFAEYLGFDLNSYPELYWIAEQARAAPIPEAWGEHVDESGNTYYHNEETGESSWEHPLDGYFKGLYERHKLAPVGSSGQAALEQEQRLVQLQAGGESRPMMRYSGSSSTSVLLHRQHSDDLTGFIPPKGATVHGLAGGARVDMSLVQRMEAERARATTEGGQVRQMRYEGSQSESVLSNAMARATLGAGAGMNTPGPAPGGGGLKAIGNTGHLSMDESALLGYGSNGTMVCVCARACVCACVRACVRACVCDCVTVAVCRSSKARGTARPVR